MRFDLSRWVAPLLLLSFGAVPVAYFRAIFTLSLRWAVLAVAVVLVLFKAIRHPLFRMAFMQATLTYVAWAGASTFWSEEPVLSMLKSGALAAMVVAGTGAGYLWVREGAIEGALDALGPWTFVVLVAALGGVDSIASSAPSEDLFVYEGLAGNSNMLGTLCAMVLPFPLGRFVLARTTRGRVWSGLAAAVLLGSIVLSNSRGAFVIVIATVIGVLGASSGRKAVNRTFIGVLLIGLLGLAAYGAPSLRSALVGKYLYKDRAFHGGGVLKSREAVWEESLDKAAAGGVIGAGYGVSIGSETGPDSLATASRYGREKGNSQLGILEELGVVGFVLYFIATVGLLTTLWGGMRRFPEEKGRAIMGLVLGSLTGMTLQSSVEAWFNAPGSPEAAYYWVMVGIGAALVTDPRRGSFGSTATVPITDPVGVIRT